MEKQEIYIFRLARIIAKSINGKLHEEEERILNAWLMTSEKNTKSYENFKNSSRLQKKIRDSREINWQKDCEIFIHELSRDSKKQIIHRNLRYAAVIILPLVITLFLIFREQSQTPMSQQTETIHPGGKKAILTLAEGRQILLSDSIATPLESQQGTQIKIDTKGVSYINPQKNVLPDSVPVVFNKLEVPRGGEYFLTLSDGSEVWLNAETEIRYPVKFSKEKRIVFVEGEAFFTVTPDKERPFIIISKQTQVKVLGTAFNFRAYPDEKEITTTLVSGSVLMSFRGQQSLSLSPGEQGSLNKLNLSLSKQKVDTYLHTAWKDGRFVFDNTRLEDLFNILARWYDLEIFYTNPSAKDIRFTGDLNKSENFNTLLKIIGESERVSFAVKHRTVCVQLK